MQNVYESRTARVGDTRWQRAADRSAYVGEQVLRVAVALAVLGGMAYVFMELPSGSNVAPAVDLCPDPPCFGDLSAGLPSIADLGVVLPVLGIVLSMLVGSLSAAAGAWDVVRWRWRSGFRRMLPLFGPMLVLVGMEVVPHVFSPCLLASLLGSEISGLCNGEDVSDRWHALHHATVGGLPLVVLYSALRRRVGRSP